METFTPPQNYTRQVFPALGSPFTLHDCVFMPEFMLLRRHLLTSQASTRQAYHHYLKVVTTNIEGLVMGKRQLKAYQIIQSSQLAYYRDDVVPEAKVNAFAKIFTSLARSYLNLNLLLLVVATTVHF